MSKRYVTKSYNYNALCDVCQFKFKAADLRRRWDGLMVCEDDWEIRHPLDFYQTRNDTHLLPFIRSDNMIFLDTSATLAVCSPPRSRGMADLGTADCAKADKVTY